jgi:hypothetical protein
MRVALLAAALTVSCTRPLAIGNSGGPPNPEAYGSKVEKAYQQVRAATAPFHDLNAAAAQGYPTDVPRCLAHPTHGAMGFHHVNRRYLSKELDVERPQILLYERDAAGKYVLNGVEYIIPYRLWPRDSVPPSIMGRQLVRSDPLELWYMHMWVWKPNPAGLFADWNPTVQCLPT